MIVDVVGSFAKQAVADLLRGEGAAIDPAVHLEQAEAWLRRAQDATPDGGVSYGYSVRGGWRPSYRETSGYIATTFFDLAARHEDAGYRERALRIARWLLEVQNRDGSFANPRYSDEGIVFDTGQVLFGLTRAYRETDDQSFLDAGRRAGDWLVGVADGEGRWTRNTHNGIPHVYNSRVAWALLQLDALHSGTGYADVARANLDWAVSQHRNGYFDQCAFEVGVAPFTHTIAYAIRGLLESGRLLSHDGYLEVARSAALAMTRHVGADGRVAGQIATDGTDVGTYCCLTGNCQLAIIWLKLFVDGEGDVYRDAAFRALDYVMSCQDVSTNNDAVRGAIKGSQPIWGRYAPLSYPNWATKFFIDAMLLRERCVREASG